MTGFFQPEPVLVLKDEHDLRKMLDDPTWARTRHGWEYEGMQGLDKYRIKSLWLIALIDQIAATGKYPYNSVVINAAEDHFGMPRTDTEGTKLSLLVYNAQGYRRSDRYHAQGFSPLTQDMIEEAHNLGKAVEIVHSSLLGGEGGAVYKPRVGPDHKLHLFLPRCRNRIIDVQGQPAKLVLKTAQPSYVPGSVPGVQVVVGKMTGSEPNVQSMPKEISA